MHCLHPRCKFTAAEDTALVDLVGEFGPNDWDTIASHLPGRNASQCRDRWLSYLSPDVTNGPWTVEEEQLLLRKHVEFGPRWRRISLFFVGRTEINVKSRFLLIQRRLQKARCQPLLGCTNGPLRFDTGPPLKRPVVIRPPVEPVHSTEPLQRPTEEEDTGDLWDPLSMNTEPGIDCVSEPWF
jgi:hypothetical protein